MTWLDKHDEGLRLHATARKLGLLGALFSRDDKKVAAAREQFKIASSAVAWNRDSPENIAFDKSALEFRPVDDNGVMIDRNLFDFVKEHAINAITKSRAAPQFDAYDRHMDTVVVDGKSVDAVMGYASAIAQRSGQIVDLADNYRLNISKYSR